MSNSNQNSGNSSKDSLTVIEPNKCYIEDFEILAFEKEEQLRYYSIWHDALFNKRRSIEFGIPESELNQSSTIKTTRNKILRPLLQTAQSINGNNNIVNVNNHDDKLESSSIDSNQTTSICSSNKKIRFSSKIKQHRTSASASSAQVFVPAVPRPLPKNHHIIPSGGQVMKYKLTKLYNKYLGRQIRRNQVIKKQNQLKIEAEIAKSYLNSWLAYTALQALHLPDQSNVHQLNAVTTTSSKILTPMTQPPTPIMSKNYNINLNSNNNNNNNQASNKTTKEGKISCKKQTKSATASLSSSSSSSSLSTMSAPASSSSLITTNTAQNPPMHLVYIDPGNIITYSNRIYPQQVADYKRNPQQTPSSKKSSAASYDVYEIMEVLANTNKTNVTITRNQNRTTQLTGSNYSHSVNSNTPGIVSTQLHLQARSYLDSMGKFYAEEAQRIEKEREEMKNEPSIEEMIGRYIKI